MFLFFGVLSCFYSWYSKIFTNKQTMRFHWKYIPMFVRVSLSSVTNIETIFYLKLEIAVAYRLLLLFGLYYFINITTCLFSELSSRSSSKTMHKRSVATCVFLLAVLLSADVATANYRKPPFNGSIFGKRGNAAGNWQLLRNVRNCWPISTS
jgi:hypothetical protein